RRRRPGRAGSRARRAPALRRRRAGRAGPWSRGDALGQRQIGNLDAGAGALAGDAPQLELVVGAVDGAEPFVDVAQADPVAERVAELILGHAQPVVEDLDERAAVADERADGDPSAADLARQAVLDRVLDERLQQHARHDDVEGPGRNLLVHLELRAESYHFDVEIFVDRLQLFTQ